MTEPEDDTPFDHARSDMNRCCHTEGPHHQCGYVDQVNSLIPVAERLAFETVGLMDRIRFSHAFAIAMQRLCEERGLRRPPPRPSPRGEA